jgi:hypothetical protein
MRTFWLLLAMASVLALAAFTLTAQNLPRVTAWTEPLSKMPRYVNQFTEYSEGQIRDQYSVTILQSERGELVIAENWPKHPVRGAIRQAVDAVAVLFYLIRPHGVLAAPILGECRAGGHSIAGNQTILGFQTTGYQENSPNRRITTWLAPELSCFPLAVTMEKRRPDGSLILDFERHTVAIEPGRKL